MLNGANRPAFNYCRTLGVCVVWAYPLPIHRRCSQCTTVNNHQPYSFFTLKHIHTQFTGSNELAAGSVPTAHHSKNYSPSKDTPSPPINAHRRSLSPPSPLQLSVNAQKESDNRANHESGFTLMHPAFQRHSNRAESPPKTSSYAHFPPLPQDLTTSISCHGAFVRSSSSGDNERFHREEVSPTSTGDSNSSELDLTVANQAPVKSATNNKC